VASLSAAFHLLIFFDGHRIMSLRLNIGKKNPNKVVDLKAACKFVDMALEAMGDPKNEGMPVECNFTGRTTFTRDGVDKLLEFSNHYSIPVVKIDNEAWLRAIAPNVGRFEVVNTIVISADTNVDSSGEWSNTLHEENGDAVDDGEIDHDASQDFQQISGGSKYNK
jgi:hypothetical protein